jgi:hypothetical protein
MEVKALKDKHIGNRNASYNKCVFGIAVAVVVVV